MKHLIFFDATCPLCQNSIAKIIAWDKKKFFSFASLSSSTADQFLVEDREKLKNENTLVLVENFQEKNFRIWIRGRGVMRIFWLLGGFWKFIGWLCFSPIFVDAIYRFIAHHRYRIGKEKKKTVEDEDRFLP
ncbi:MAG: DUF393 domain-containing protein [Chlamydiae bacterium]|nr:DUF393 domain-containing protein [Chlamydiota bacterium]